MTTGRAHHGESEASEGWGRVALSPSPRYVKSWPSDRSSFVKTWRGASGGRASEQHPSGDEREHDEREHQHERVTSSSCSNT